MKIENIQKTHDILKWLINVGCFLGKHELLFHNFQQQIMVRIHPWYMAIRSVSPLSPLLPRTKVVLIRGKSLVLFGIPRCPCSSFKRSMSCVRAKEGGGDRAMSPDIYIWGRHPVKKIVLEGNYGIIQIKELVPVIHPNQGVPSITMAQVMHLKNQHVATSACVFVRRSSFRRFSLTQTTASSARALVTVPRWLSGSSGLQKLNVMEVKGRCANLLAMQKLHSNSLLTHTLARIHELCYNQWIQSDWKIKF